MVLFNNSTRQQLRRTLK